MGVSLSLLIIKIENRVGCRTIRDHFTKKAVETEEVELRILANRAYSDTSIKNTVLRPNRQYKASTAEVAEYRYS